jgi:hypothetical protein
MSFKLVTNMNGPALNAPTALATLHVLQLYSWGPRIIATDRQAPRIYPPMIPLCSRFDSVLFTPKDVRNCKL